MRIVILTDSNMYENRAEQVRQKLIGSHEVTVISADFDHVKKKTCTTGRDGFVYLHKRPYKRNLSIARLFSHYDFAKRAFKEIEGIDPDLIYVMVPANSNAHFAAKYKKAHGSVKLVFDLVDLWPESFPIKKLKWIPVFKIWKNLRDKSFSSADIVVSECELYTKVLKKALGDLPCFTLYLAINESGEQKLPQLSDEGLSLCYLGSVNNIIDIPFISRTVSALCRYSRVTVNIIGKGERMQEFTRALQSAGAEVVLHGVIYDDGQKQQIFNRCHFGINIMRDTVCVGLTMKSTDYFEAGLPLLNTIKGDTLEMIDSFKAGFNLTADKLDEVALKISELTEQDFINMRRGALEIFRQKLSITAFDESIKPIIKEMEKSND